MSIERQAGRLATIHMRNVLENRVVEKPEKVKPTGLLVPKKMLGSENTSTPSSEVLKVEEIMRTIREAMKREPDGV